jgi:hypothetical protein
VVSVVAVVVVAVAAAAVVVVVVVSQQPKKIRQELITPYLRLGDMGLKYELGDQIIMTKLFTSIVTSSR